MKPIVVAILLSLPNAAVSQDLGLGWQVYLEACAGCHGETGQGEGAKAALLTGPVPDLTLLAQRNGGTFDTVRAIHLIDGRAGLAAHNGPMPMFGGLLIGDAAVVDAVDGSPVATTVPILSVVHWLESIQVEE